MNIKRRSGSTFFDLDITDGDATWYLTDRFNASGATRLGGGRLNIREAIWKGDKIFGFGDTDYALQVSSSKAGPKFWVSNQAGFETDIMALEVYIDGVLTEVNPGDDFTGAGKLEIKHTTQVCLDDANNTPFASMAWSYGWKGGVYGFKVDITYLATVYRWSEYASNTGGDGACGTNAPWKCDRVEAGSNDHTSLGCHGNPSNWLWDKADKTFKMHFKRGASDQAKVTVIADTPIRQLTNDHGDNLVITYHVTNDGTKPVTQNPGNTAHHGHTITIT